MTTPTSNENEFSRALRIAGKSFLTSIAIAIMVIGVGELIFASSGLIWLSRIVGGSVIVFGLTSWQRRLKPIFLKGEEDEWYLLQGWDGRTIKFIKAGMNRIAPVHTTKYWAQVNPILVKVDTTVQNKTLDTFDIHLRALFEVYPDLATTSAQIKWLRKHYPDTITAMATGMLEDVAVNAMRNVTSFNVAIEKETEAQLKSAIEKKFIGWQNYGVFINTDVTLVDIMVTKDVLQQRITARAELSSLQIIRDVAHDMGISTDELLIQRALEKLPDARTRQSVSEIAAVLQMLRSQPVGELEAGDVVEVSEQDRETKQDSPETMDNDLHEDEEEEIIEPPIELESDTRPTSFVEGVYESLDDIDPDANTSGTIYSPFD